MDLAKGEKFAFLGFDFRRTLSNNGVWRPQYTPRIKKRTALLEKLREIFRRFTSQPGAGDRIDQSDSAGVGELLRSGPLQSVLQLRPTLGGDEDQAPDDARTETPGLRLGEVE